jgi:hypothetical protein
MPKALSVHFGIMSGGRCDLILRDAATPLLSMRARALEPHAEEAQSAVSKYEVALDQPNTT